MASGWNWTTVPALTAPLMNQRMKALEGHLGIVATAASAIPATTLQPYFESLRQVAGATAATADLFLQVRVPLNLDGTSRSGTLSAWVNAAGSGDADPTGDPDGTIAVTGDTLLSPADLWDLTAGGTASLLDNLPVHSGTGKRIFFQLVLADATATGVVDFLLAPTTSPIQADGALGAATVGTLQLVDTSVIAAKLAADAVEREKILDGAVNDLKLADAAVTAAKVAIDAIDATKLQDSAVTAQKIADAAVERTKIALAAIDTTRLEDAAVVGAKIADEALTLAKFALGIEPVGISTAGTLPTTKTTSALYWSGALYRWDGSAYVKSVPATDLSGTIASTQITDGAVSTPKLAANAVTAAKIAAGTITSNEIAALTITAGNIAASTITGAKIAALTLTAANMVAGTITSNEIATGTITSGNIAANTITAGNIAAATITGAKIAALTIAAGNLAADSVDASKIVAASITGDRIAALTITGGLISANAITADKILSHTITALQIAAGTITANEIAADTIVAGNIAAGAIGASEIAAGAIVAGKIAAGVVTATEIAGSTITGDKIAATTITAANLVVGTITGDRIAASTITSDKISVSSLSALSANIGTVTAGLLQNSTGAYGISLGAAVEGVYSRYISFNTADHFIKHEGLILDHSGNAFFSGALSAATGTFAGDISAASGTFSGTVASSSFTSTSPSFSFGLDITGGLSVGGGLSCDSSGTFDGGVQVRDYTSLELLGDVGVGFSGWQEHVSNDGNFNRLFIRSGVTRFYMGGSSGDHNAYATGGSWVDSSDERLKTDITPITDPVQRLRALPAVRYQRMLTGQYEMGWLAQSVRQVIPEAVSEMGTAEGLQNVLALNKGAMTAVLWEAVREMEMRMQLAGI